MMSARAKTLNHALKFSAAYIALALPGLSHAQEASQAEEETVSQGDIIVTATRRSEALSDIPLAVSAITAETLANSGASDIRALNQVSPSLLVSSTSSEAAAGGARIRGIGTVGDNPGLESSVATFVDGVYRNRAGVGLSELGAIERIEVLRGPQGTLFGRNASAGLISVITRKPAFDFGAEAEFTYGNFDTLRAVGGVTGPITEKIAARLDGVYFKRDGFLTDVVSGRDINNRDRYLLRGQLLIEPSDDLSFRLIADYASRNEECCGATFLPARNVTPAAGSTPGAERPVNFGANSILALERALGGIISDDTYARETSITPGFGYRSDVKDWGISGELNYSFGNANLTSITAYRDWRLVRGQDADFNNLDIFHRSGTDADAQRQSFKTFTQELRLQGTALNDRLDFLIGGYFANEKLNLRDNFQYGSDYERYANCLTVAALAGSASQPGLLSPASPGCINSAIATAIAGNAAVPAALRGPVGLFAGLAVPGQFGFRGVAAALGNPALTLNGTSLDDRYAQTSRNFALFTHNVVQIIPDKLSLTLGLRYTNEKKTLDASFSDNNRFCQAIRASATLSGLAALPCVIPNVPGGSYSQDNAVKKESEFTGTAVLSFKPVDGLLTYASYSRGYKAGGFNLDRSGLTFGTPDTNQLTFDPEIVSAYEIGAKFNGTGFDLNLSVFKQDFTGFQLNTFNGINFIVENIYACADSLNGTDRDNSSTTGACTSKLKPGVESKGVEIEAYLRPARNVAVNMGLTYTDTKYKDDLVGTAGRPLAAALFQLPGSRLSNSAQYVATSSISWTPPIGGSGLSGLVYVDARLSSDINTGSDKDEEKIQDGVTIVNARLGIRGDQQKWAVEIWAQNLFNTNYQQVSFDAPLQGAGTINAVRQGFAASSTQLYGAFLAEPRTYGITVRGKF
jgi:iron complex outermembrane recepter protein